MMKLEVQRETCQTGMPRKPLGQVASGKARAMVGIIKRYNIIGIMENNMEITLGL